MTHPTSEATQLKVGQTRVARSYTEKTKTIHFKLAPHIFEKLEELATQDHRTVANFTSHIVTQLVTLKKITLANYTD